MNPIKVGIIGYGKIGKVRRAAIENNSNYALKSVCDRDMSSSGASDCGITAFSDYQELLRQDLDAVFICTPNHVTAAAVIVALRSGKHVFCEKPPGRNLTEVQAIIEEESKNPGLKLMFGFNHRYHEAMRQALAILSSGRLGSILWMRGVYGKSGGQDFETLWRSKREIAGGGILLDQGIHMVDLFRLFCGDFSEVKSFVANSHWDIDVEDNAFALLRNERGQIAMLHSSSTQWKHLFSLEIYASGGYVTINGILSGTRSYGRETLIVARRQSDHCSTPGSPREEVAYFDKDESWQLEVAEFAQCIRLDKRVEVGGSMDAFKAMELICRIYENDSSWMSKGLTEKIA